MKASAKKKTTVKWSAGHAAKMRRKMIYMFDAAFARSLSDAEFRKVERAIDLLVHAGDEAASGALLKTVSVEGQTQFWRSVTLSQVMRLEKEYQAKLHSRFWCALARAATRVLEQFEDERNADTEEQELGARVANASGAQQ